jgi:hypothetical protein
LKRARHSADDVFAACQDAAYEPLTISIPETLLATADEVIR